MAGARCPSGPLQCIRSAAVSPGFGWGQFTQHPHQVHLFLLPGTNFTLRELGLGEVTPPHGTLYRTDIGLPHCGYSMGASSDVDLEADTVLSPEHPVRLWGRSTRSGRSSCLSSRANSNLTLTDTEHENTETGEWPTRPVGCQVARPGDQIRILISLLHCWVKNCFARRRQKPKPFALSCETSPYQ